MRKSILFLLASVVLNVTVSFALTISSPQTGGSNQTQSVDEQEAAKLYSTFSSLTMRERKAFFSNSTPEAKSALWRAHLRLYLSNHPELKETQKEVIQSTIALITPQLFEIPQASPDWQTKVDVPLQRLTRRFLEVFSREIARELLTGLGGPEPQQGSNSVLPQNISLVKSTSRSPQEYCTCS